MSNLDQKFENAANKIEVVANKAWKKRSFRILSKSVSAAAINQQLLVCLLWVRQGLFVI